MNYSLVIKLKKIDREFHKYFDFIHFAERTFGKGSRKYKHAITLNTLQISKSQNELDKLISRYGYPGKTLVGKEYDIAFSIINYADIEYRKKYYDLIVEAADKGELDWLDVAFFVDKVRVDIKEKQLYATQYKYNEEGNKQFYFPIDKKEKLNERRKKVGLEEVDISILNFIEYVGCFLMFLM